MKEKVETDIDIGKIIQNGLKKKGWSNKKLAEILGVSPPTVSNWIKNNRKPPVDIFVKMVITLDIIEDIFPKAERKLIKRKEINQKLEEIKVQLAELEHQLKE